MARQPGFSGDFWPSPDQRLLIETATATEAAKRRKKWDQVRASFDIDRLEFGSFAIMPLLGRALASLDPADGLLPRLHGIERRTWVTNTMLIERAVPALAALNRSSVEFLVTQSAALAPFYYEALGLRPMYEIELEIRPGGLAEVRRALTEWRPVNGIAGRVVTLRSGEGTLRVRPGSTPSLVSADGSGPADNIWTNATRKDLMGEPVTLADPTSLLLMVCADGARARTGLPTQWILDALILARRADPPIDWDRFVAVAARCQAARRIGFAIRYLNGLDLGGPPHAEALESCALPRRAALGTRLEGRGGAGGVWGALGRGYLSQSDRSLLRSTLGLPAAMAAERGLTSTLGLPAAVLRRLRRPTQQSPANDVVHDIGEDRAAEH